MIKIASSALVGVVLGVALGNYTASTPAITSIYQHEDAKPSIDPLEMMNRAKDLPVMEIENPV